MSTIRVARRHHYTTIDRRTLNDDRLSFRARGLLVWLLDKPDGWEVRSSDIAKMTKEGRDAIRVALGELGACGYLVRKRSRGERGRWVTETIIYEAPSKESPGGTGDWESGAGRPGVGEPGANTNTVTEDCYPQTPGEPPAWFVKGGYGRKQA